MNKNFTIFCLILFVGTSFAQSGWNDVSLMSKIKLLFRGTVDFNNQNLTNINYLCLGGGM